MAVVSIKGDTKDAEKKIKALKQDIDNLDKAARKPKKVNVQTKAIGTSGISAHAGLGSMSLGMAVAGGTMVGGLAASALTKLVNVLSGAIPALLKFGLGIDNVTGLMSKWGKALEAYSNAPEHALQRADNMDALDDERRAHNNRTLAEEYAWNEAFSNVGGSEFKNQILTRVQSLVEQALGGDVTALDTISKLDRVTGTTFSPTRGEEINEYALQSHLGELSTHEIVAEILKNYHNAKETGDYSNVDAIEKLFGRRGMAVVNKLSDIADVERQKDLYVQKWNETHTNEQEIMAQAAKAEEIRSLGKVYQYGVPEGGEKNIETGALNQAETDKLTYDALGGDGSKIQEQAISELKKDWNKIVDQAVASPLGKAINESVVKPLEQYSDELTAAIDTTKEIVSKFREDVAKFSDVANNINNIPEKVVEPAKSVLKPLGNAYNSGFDLQLKWASAMLSPFLGVDPTHQIKPELPTPSEGQIRAFGDNAYKPLVEDDPMYNMQRELEQQLIDKAKAAGEAIPDFLDPATFNKRFWESLNPPKVEQQKSEETTKVNKEVVTALQDVSSNLKNNIAATQNMTNTLKSGLTINGTNATGGTASFV